MKSEQKGRYFTITKGTPILAAKRTLEGRLEVEPKITTKDSSYSMEDIEIQAWSKREGALMDENHFAERGFFGFELSANASGYDLIICHISNTKLIQNY